MTCLIGALWFKAVVRILCQSSERRDRQRRWAITTQRLVGTWARPIRLFLILLGIAGVYVCAVRGYDEYSRRLFWNERFGQYTTWPVGWAIPGWHLPSPVVDKVGNIVAVDYRLNLLLVLPAKGGAPEDAAAWETSFRLLHRIIGSTTRNEAHVVRGGRDITIRRTENKLIVVGLDGTVEKADLPAGVAKQCWLRRGETGGDLRGWLIPLLAEKMPQLPPLLRDGAAAATQPGPGPEDRQR